MKYINSLTKSPSRSDKIFALLSYLWILFLIPLLLKNDNEFIKFHAKQGMILFVFWLFIWGLFWLPFISALLFLLIIIGSAIGIVACLQGRYWELPIVGKFARKINI